MKEHEKAYFEDLLLKAVQATKGENSGLIADIKKDIAELKGNYSKRELDHFIGELHADIKKILEQTTKTNGRVNGLEETRTKMWTAISVLTVLGGTIIGLSIMAIQSKIDKGIEQALARYETKSNE